MIILLHNKALEAPLPYVPVSAIDLVMPPDIRRHQPLHPFAQFLCLLRPHDHMEVVWHEAVRKNFDRIEPSAQSQEVGKRLEILALMEDILLPVAAVVDVVDKSVSKGSGNSRHDFS